MKRLLLSFVVMLLCVSSFAQEPMVTLTFTARDQNTNEYVQLSRFEIADNTYGWSESFTWPDTVVEIIVPLGINENAANTGLQLAQNAPNPFNGTTDVNLAVNEPGAVVLELADVNGRPVATRNVTLTPASHHFSIRAANAGIYFLTARQNGKTTSVKMVNTGNSSGNSIEYVGSEFCGITPRLQPKSDTRGIVFNGFSLGDTMTYKGYVVADGVEFESEIIVKQQFASETITFLVQLPDRDACPGVPTVTDYDGNVYPTVQIGNQCWMKENLKTTHYASGAEIPHLSDASMVDPSYGYPENMPGNMNNYGLLYNWPAVMGGASSSDANPSGVLGVCPTGWHVPSDSEWKEMEAAVGVPTAALDEMNTYRGNIAVTLAGGSEGSWTASTEAARRATFRIPTAIVPAFPFCRLAPSRGWMPASGIWLFSGRARSTAITTAFCAHCTIRSRACAATSWRRHSAPRFAA